MTIRFVVAGLPLGKQRVRFTQEGQRPFTPQKTVNYEGRIAHEAQQAMDGRPLLQGPLSVEIMVRLPVPVSKPYKWRLRALAGEILPTRKPDADNVAKFLDALNLIVWGDDAQITDLVVRKRYHENPALLVSIDEVATGIFS